jgi:hypothetical protein
MSSNHYYIKFSEKGKTGSNTEVGFRLTDFYLHSIPNNRKQWRNDSRLYKVTWTDMNNVPQTSLPINYLEIARFIRENGFFSYSHFNLAPMNCFWLDFSLDLKINWHRFDHTGPEGLAVNDGVPQQQYGNGYPIKPKLNREGHSYTTLQPQLMNRIMSLRKRLIDDSNEALTDNWFFDLRSLISDAVSLVEITLTQLYIKAEYDPLENWQFDKEQLGERHGRRFEDKFNWIYKITGKHINAENFMPSFTVLRELRNHMMHFDPPSLIVTIEESVIWLNYIIDVGYLLIKIREAIGANVSIQLLNFILQKEAVFNPEVHFSARLPIGTGNADYESSNWPKK